MKTPPLLLAGALALVLVACSGTAGAPAAPGSSAPTSSAGPSASPPAPTAVPGGPAAPSGDVPPDGKGGGTNPNPGGVDGQPQQVEPVPGARNVRDVAATALEASVNGRRVAVRVAWWGGVEPCDVLAGVDVARDGNAFMLTVRAGASPDMGQDVMCVEMAVLKATIVDLGELEPGTYTIQAMGDAPGVEVIVQ